MDEQMSIKEVEVEAQGHILGCHKTSDSNTIVHFIATILESLLFKSKHYIVAFHTLQLNFILKQKLFNHVNPSYIHLFLAAPLGLVRIKMNRIYFFPSRLA